MMNQLRLFVILILLCLPASAAASVYRIPLKNFLAVDVVELRGASANTEEREDSIPIGARWDVKGAALRFDYICSKGLLPGASHLTLLVNDMPAGQIPLDPRAPEGRAEIQINPEILTPGYNRLVFSVTQHATREECEDPTLPELWTRLDLTRAELDLELSPLPVPENLGSVGDVLLDVRDLVSESLHIVVPEITSEYLARAGLVAAGAALCREYRPIKITLSDQLAEGRDNLVIGSPGFLEALNLQTSMLPAGASIAITRLPLPPASEETGEEIEETGEEIEVAGEESGAPGEENGEIGEEGGGLEERPEADDAPFPDPYHGVICIVGDTDTDLDLAARAFGLMSINFPQTPVVAVSKVAEPELSVYRYRNGLRENRDYSLASLNFNTTTFRGTQPSPKKITFRLPSDVHIEPNQVLQLSLNLAYGSGMRSDSALNLEMNGKFVAAIPLSNPDGGSFQGYRVQVLGSALQPGYNTLRLVPVLTSPVSDPCAPVQTGNLTLTVFEDSYCTVPAYGHWIRMPQLETFVEDAFPFGRWPDMRETTICLPTATFSQAAAALNLVALAAQKIGYPPTGLSWHLGPLEAVPRDRDVILASSLAYFETGPTGTGLRDGSPLGKTSRILQPHLSRSEGRESMPESWRERLLRWLGKPSELLPFGRRIDSSEQTYSVRDLSGWGFAVETARSEEIQRTLLVLAAQDENDLVLTSHQLWDSGLQASVSGGAVAIRLTQEPPLVKVLDTGGAYYLGEVAPFPVISNLINRYPWRALFLLLVILGGCSLLITVTLKKIRKRRLTDA